MAAWRRNSTALSLEVVMGVSSITLATAVARAVAFLSVLKATKVSLYSFQIERLLFDWGHTFSCRSRAQRLTMTRESFAFSRWNLNVHCQFIHCGGNMSKHKKCESSDNALREFYEFCGLSSATIEGAIKARYEESTTAAHRDRAVAEVMARRKRISPKWGGD
jgi:hypothetical protein